MTELWELPDAELWGRLDAAALQDDFKASKQAELAERMRKYLGRPATAKELEQTLAQLEMAEWVAQTVCRALDAMPGFCAQFARALQGMVESMQKMATTLSQSARQAEGDMPPSPAHRHSTTLHAALSTNVRRFQPCFVPTCRTFYARRVC